MVAAHSGKEDLSDVEPEVREIFASSDLSRDPQRLNVFMFALDAQGEVVHEFHGLPGSGRSLGPGRSDHKVEIEKARKVLKLSNVDAETTGGLLPGLPDLNDSRSGVPAGARIFIRQDDPSNSHFSQVPVVEVVPMKPHEWNALSFAERATEIDAEALRSWLVWLYPAGIRAADEQKRFQQFSGTLKWEPAGRDEKSRYALLRGPVRLAKGDETQSAFEGEFQAVVSYRLDAPEVQSLRAIVEGTYLYRLRGASPQKLKAAIESRPDEHVD